jgi:fructokinase
VDTLVPTLVVGEALVDLVRTADGRVREHVGGSPANVAFGLAALEHSVDLATWFGTDAHGAEIEEVCRSRGIAVTPGSRRAKSTAVAQATLDATGSATYTFELDWAPTALPDPAPYGHVHSGSIATVLEPGATAVRDLLTQARTQATISYDPNLRPALMDRAQARRAVRAALKLADVVKASDEDLAWLAPDEPLEAVMVQWRALGAALVVVTRGAAGALVLTTRDAQPVALPATSTRVADTVGAGDSFMAGLLSGLLDAELVGSAKARRRLQDAPFELVRPAVERGLQTAARTVARAGAYAPTRSELG